MCSSSLRRAPCPGTVQVGTRPFTLAHHCTPRAGAFWQPHAGARVGSITDEEGGADLVARLGTLEGCGVARVLPRAQHLVDLVGREPELCIVAAVGARACHVAVLINGAVEVDGVALVLQVWRGLVRVLGEDCGKRRLTLTSCVQLYVHVLDSPRSCGTCTTPSWLAVGVDADTRVTPLIATATTTTAHTKASDEGMLTKVCESALV